MTTVPVTATRGVGGTVSVSGAGAERPVIGFWESGLGFGDGIVGVVSDSEKKGY